MITVFIRAHLFPFFVMITDRSILIITWHGDLLHSRWPFWSGDLLGVGLATWEEHRALALPLRQAHQLHHAVQLHLLHVVIG